MSKQKITLVIPCFNEQESLPIFYKEISKVLHSMECDYELIFIDDGSNDDTLKLLRKFGENDKNLKYVSFSRNFGKEAAMYAGFQNVDGDYVVVMDADMQDPPSLLPKMLKILCTQNYDCVATRRISRKGEPHIRSWFAKKFYKLINKISDADIMDGARDFRLMKRKMVDSIVAYIKKGYLTREDVEKYKNQVKSLKNVMFDENCSYRSSFVQSDCLIADYSSIVIEFLLMGKPVIYLSDVRKIETTIANAFYVSKNVQETKEYIKQLAKGEDGKRQNRLDVLKATIYKKGTCKRIADVLNKI